MPNYNSEKICSNVSSCVGQFTTVHPIIADPPELTSGIPTRWLPMVNIPQIASSIASTLQYNRLPPLQIRGKRRERPQPACHLSSHISTGFSMFPLFVVFKIVHGLCRNARICRVLVCTTADGLSKKMRPIHQCYIWSTPCWQTMCITGARFTRIYGFHLT